MSNQHTNLKLYSKAPLPFVGQKRFFLKQFRALLDECISGDGEGWTIIDAFGGSGLLSNNAKFCKPKAHVVFNDFDGYRTRLDSISDSNRLRRLLATVLADEPRHKKLNQSAKLKVKNILDSFDGVIDMRAVSTWLLFAGNHVNSLDELYTKTLYNTVRKSDYAIADDYLTDIEVVCQSFNQLLPAHVHKSKTLLLLDPPYVCTEQGMYANANYFGMVQFLELMRFVRPPYIFFSSTRSELLDYMHFIEKYEADDWKRFGGFGRLSFNSTINNTSSYEDNLIYRFK